MAQNYYHKPYLRIMIYGGGRRLTKTIDKILAKKRDENAPQFRIKTLVFTRLKLQASNME
uniref:Uncharacterized protein n=1 Tax=Rhizophora mucronata TaxID=61149 RepID=A0A2P2NNU8_RHIMU